MKISFQLYLIKY